MTEQVQEQVQPTVAEQVMKLEGESRDNWLKTGKLPEAEVKTEAESSTATTEEQPEVKQDSEKQDQARKPSRREQRILELLNENKRLSSELEKTKRSEPKETPVEQKEAREVKEVKADVSKKPVVGDFTSYEDYIEAIADWKADQKIAERFKERESAAKSSEVEKANKEIEQIWMERVDESKKLHDDYEAIAFNKDLPIKSGSVVDRWILESDKGPEILYYLGSNPEELIRINDLPQISQARELTKIESGLEKTVKTKITKAPKPPADLNGNGTVSRDPADEALEQGNFRKYMEAQNAKELKARKG